MRKPAWTPPQYIGQNLYIKPSYIVSIPEYDKTGGGMSIEQLLNHENLHDNKQRGALSRKAISNLRNAINWLALASQPKRVYDKSTGKTFSFKVNFVTLTLPETLAPVSSAHLQKKLLNPFLVHMRKVHELKNYVWRIEHQANGRLHVHIATDTFIHWRDIRQAWNARLKKNGLLAEFAEKFKHYNPNSTDVHSVTKIKNIAGYIAKYMSKKNSVYKLCRKAKGTKLSPMNRAGWYSQRINFWNSPMNPRPISGRIWGCNYELSQAGKTCVHIPATEIRESMKCLIESDLECKPIIIQKADFSTPRIIGEIFYLKARDWLRQITGPVLEAFTNTRLMIASLARNYTVFELT